MSAALAIALVDPARAERKRCSDFDWECAHVMDHARCHAGGHGVYANGERWHLAPADGECPYLTKEEQ